MTFHNSTTSNLSVREFRKFIALARSRDFFWTLKDIKNTKEKKGVILIYGTRDTLSPLQRRGLREQLNTYSNMEITYTLFSTAFSQQIAAFSNFNKIRSIFKGSVFQIKITFPYESNSSTRNAFFEQIKTHRIADNINLDFKPSVVFLPLNQGSFASNRFNIVKTSFQKGLPITQGPVFIYFLLSAFVTKVVCVVKA